MKIWFLCSIILIVLCCLTFKWADRPGDALDNRSFAFLLLVLVTVVDVLAFFITAIWKALA